MANITGGIGFKEMGQFDLILSTAVFHEALEVWRKFDSSDGFTAEEVARRPVHGRVEPCLEAIREMVRAPAGRFVSMERCSGGTHRLGWLSELGRAGLIPELRRSPFIQAEFDGNVERMPAYVLGPAGVTAVSTVDFIAHEMSLESDGISGAEWKDMTAEGIYWTLSGRELVRSAEFKYFDGSGTLRWELSPLGPICIVFETTTRGWRHLKLASSLHEHELAASLDELKARLAVHAEIRE